MNETSKGVLLVVDNEPSGHGALKRELAQAGYVVLDAGDASAAMGLVRSRPVDVVIHDSHSTESDNLRFLDEVKRSSPRTQVILVAASASVGTAVAAIKRGAYDYLIKPFPMESLLQKLEAMRVSQPWPSAQPNGEEAAQSIGARAMDSLLGYSWRGNARALAQVIERAILSATGELPAASTTQSAEIPAGSSAEVAGLTETIADIERSLIDAALQRAAGNQARAAQFLGIPRTTLRDKMAKYGMSGNAVGKRAAHS